MCIFCQRKLLKFSNYIYILRALSFSRFSEMHTSLPCYHLIFASSRVDLVSSSSVTKSNIATNIILSSDEFSRSIKISPPIRIVNVSICTSIKHYHFTNKWPAGNKKRNALAIGRFVAYKEREQNRLNQINDRILRNISTHNLGVGRFITRIETRLLTYALQMNLGWSPRTCLYYNSGIINNRIYEWSKINIYHVLAPLSKA